ncbi:conserved Plasmodium protein, unknown function [Plasmodium knowlesi strain H]|uniref:Uncharacterized protein n=3 Tax=Plasmodium knowlesi TaxID=5850 RepID=A0A5K1TUP2_PLAKH|nr:conserved Plasmodium protein, unknown function [Plasmodium knowlesi strain H]OTN65992.1 Uncharacterized protein PKNOH_S100030000 [Plasmodium knowlesi]CAA9987665.1 conserved Plasmodium protein, unknown function [Plasmodium knowlesi strain H]SBO26879.1 conserved Plasmodium protein, unknown function [Plasmodium knowlesi strain H]SBO29657.1 conserved Plasmodium protein, unknown function [Plasmodium knowlesi strain H]VVS77139.1 conserved Plasmodium protein, unknown function [Plasmodium knowlesi |eukprot:XP_002258663.1 hypothetical protein, conserved in Plasmodium species [Plasmodium knowlesi strain H]
MNVFNFSRMEKNKVNETQPVYAKKGRSHDSSNEECSKLKIKGGHITHMCSEGMPGNSLNAGYTNGHSLNNMLMKKKIGNVHKDEWKIKEPVLLCDKSGNQKKIDVLVYPVCDQNNFYNLKGKNNDPPRKYVSVGSASHGREGKQVCTKNFFLQKASTNEAFFTCGNSNKMEKGFLKGEDEKKKKKKNSPATEMLSEMGTAHNKKSVHSGNIECVSEFTHQLKNKNEMLYPVDYNVSDAVCFSYKGKKNEGNFPGVFSATMEEKGLHACVNCVNSNVEEQHFVSSPHGGISTQGEFHQKGVTLPHKKCADTPPSKRSEIIYSNPQGFEDNSCREDRILSGCLHTFSETIPERKISRLISKGEEEEWSSDTPDRFDEPFLCDTLHGCGDVDEGEENKPLKLCRRRINEHTDWCLMKSGMHIMKTSGSNGSSFMKRMGMETQGSVSGGVENKFSLICGGILPSKCRGSCAEGLDNVAKVCQIPPDYMMPYERSLKDQFRCQGGMNNLSRSISEVIIENADEVGEGKSTEDLYFTTKEEMKKNKEKGGENMVTYNCSDDVNTPGEDALVMDKDEGDMHEMSTGGEEEEDTRDVFIMHDVRGGENVVCSSYMEDMKKGKLSTHGSFTTEVSFEREGENSSGWIGQGVINVVPDVPSNEMRTPYLSDDRRKGKERGKSCEEDLGMKCIMHLLTVLERERRRIGRGGEKKGEVMKKGRRGTHDKGEGDARTYFAKYVDEIFRNEEEVENGHIGGEGTKGEREKMTDRNGKGKEKWCAALLDRVENHLGALDITLNEILQLNKVKKIFWYLYMKYKVADSITIEKFCELLKEKINEEMSKNYFKEYVMWENFHSFCKSNVGNFDYKIMILENLFCLLKSYPLDYEENKGCFYMLNPQRNKMMKSSSVHEEKNAKVHLVKNKMNYLKLTREVNIHFKNNFFFLDKIFIPKDAFFFVKDMQNIRLKDGSSKTLYVHQALVQDLNEDSEEKNSFDGFYAGNPPHQSDYYKYIRKKKVQSKMRKMKEFILYYYGFPSVQHFFEALLEFEREYKKAQRGWSSLKGGVVQEEATQSLELTAKLYDKYGRKPRVKGWCDAHVGGTYPQFRNYHLKEYPLEGQGGNSEKKVDGVKIMEKTRESNRQFGEKFPDTQKRNHSEYTYDEEIKCDIAAMFAKWRKEDHQDKQKTDLQKTDSLKIDSIKIDSLKIDSLKIDSLKIDSLKIDSLKIDSIERNVRKEEEGNVIFPCEGGGHCSEESEPYWLSETIEEVSPTYENFFNTVDAAKKVKEINLRTLKLFTENMRKVKGYPNFTSVDEVFWGICFSDPDLPKHILCEKKIFPKNVSFNGFMRSMRYVPYVIPDFPVPSRHFISMYQSEKANEVFNSRNAFLNLLKYDGKNSEMVLLRNKIIYDIVKLFVFLSSNFGVETGKYGKAAGMSHGDATPMVDSSYYINYKYNLKKGRECVSNRGEYQDTSSSCSLYYIPSSLDDEIGDDSEGSLSVTQKNEGKEGMPHEGYHISHSTLEQGSRKMEKKEQSYCRRRHPDEGCSNSVAELLMRKNKKMSYKYVPKWHMSNDMFLSRLVSFDEIQISLEKIYPLFMIQTALIFMIHISCCTLKEEEWRYFFEGPFTLYKSLTPEEVAMRYIKIKGSEFFKLSNIKFNKNINLHQVFMNIPENMQCAEIYRLAINGESTSTGYSAEPFDIYHLMFVSRVFWYIFLYSDNFLLLRSSLFWDAPQ